MRTTKPKAAAAARIGAGLGGRKQAELLGLLKSCFVRTEPWIQAGKYMSALVSEMPRRNGWTIAQHAGDRDPDRTQRLLNRAAWDTFAAMSQVGRFAASGLDQAARRNRRRGGLVIGAIDETGDVETVLVPYGSTLASVCPPCAERAKTLRAAQCREGWHLEDEPGITPAPATEDQKWWITLRAEAQQHRDHAESAGQDTVDLDELITELDAEITKAGIRGKAAPARPKRRHRSTRRRQDAPDLPRRKISPRTLGKSYTAPDGKTFRPSLFVTLTCPSYGRVGENGAPADPQTYQYDQAARDALHFAALFDRFIQNLHRYLGYDVQYFAAVEPQKRLAAPSAAHPPPSADRRAGLSLLLRARGPAADQDQADPRCRAEMAGRRGFRVREGLLRPGPVPGRLYTAITRHIVLVMAALAICAVTAALLRDRTDTQAPPPVTPDQAPPEDPGMIPLTVPEVRRLLASALQRQHPPGHATRWLNWRRRHQARSRWFHQRTRLNRGNALVS